MSANPEFDILYAARNVRILLSPSHTLETFGNTLLNYHLVTELPDRPGKIRVREGRLEAHKPLVITPRMADVETEGLDEAAQSYVSWLREHVENMRILRYGYRLKSDNFSEQIVSGTLAGVSRQVKETVAASNDPLAAVLMGVDEPWQVALVELWRREVDRSAQHNIAELNAKGKLF